VPEAWKRKDEALDLRIDREFVEWTEMSGDIWTSQDCSEEFVSLEKNPERFTGYSGIKATRIWDLLYSLSCISSSPSDPSSSSSDPSSSSSSSSSIEGPCLEERLLYRIVSGLHSSVSAHLAYHYLPQASSSKEEPNLPEFVRRVGAFPDRLQNMYFTYLVLLRSVPSSTSSFIFLFILLFFPFSF